MNHQSYLRGWQVTRKNTLWVAAIATVLALSACGKEETSEAPSTSTVSTEAGKRDSAWG